MLAELLLVDSNAPGYTGYYHGNTANKGGVVDPLNDIDDDSDSDSDHSDCDKDDSRYYSYNNCGHSHGRGTTRMATSVGGRLVATVSAVESLGAHAVAGTHQIN
jgi:hypothetical protein